MAKAKPKDFDERFFERSRGRCGGRVVLIGRRLAPEDVAGRLIAGDQRGDLILEYDLTDEQISACCVHYHQHGTERNA